MSLVERLAVTLLVVVFADALAFAPAVLSARYRTFREVAVCVVIASVIIVAVVPLAVGL